MKKIVLLIVVCLLTVTILEAAETEGANPNTTMWTGLGIFIAVLAAVISKGPLAALFAKLKERNSVSNGDVDRAVESIFNKFGLPPVLSDIIGDIASEVAIKFDLVTVDESCVRNEVIVKLINLVAVKDSAKAAVILNLPPKYLTSANKRIQATNKFISLDATSGSKLSQVVSKKIHDERALSGLQPTTPVDPGHGG
jgi:hypothetical protein